MPSNHALTIALVLSTCLPVCAEGPSFPNASASTPEIAALIKSANDSYMQCITTDISINKERNRLGNQSMVEPPGPQPRLITVDPIAWPQDKNSSTKRKGRIVLEVAVSITGKAICSRILSCTVPDLAIAKSALSANEAFHFKPALDESANPVSSLTLVVFEFYKDGSVKVKQ